MGGWLLSHFSPETLSDVGFDILIVAMLGEVAVWLIPDHSALHKHAAFIFAALAVGGYAIERVGEDAITNALKDRAATAEERFRDRTFSKEDHDKVVSLIKALPRPIESKITFDLTVGNKDAKNFGTLLAGALSDATGTTIEPPRGLSTCTECTGVWVCVNNTVTPATADDGNAIRHVFEAVGIKKVEFCNDPKNGMGGPDFVKILVGPKP